MLEASLTRRIGRPVQVTEVDLLDLPAEETGLVIDAMASGAEGTYALFAGRMLHAGELDAAAIGDALRALV